MSFENLVIESKKHFPDLKIKYKNQSWFMKLIGFLFFFNKSFMTKYTTTIGSTVYFTDESNVKNRPVSSAITLLHELVHINDAHKVSKPLFGFLYLTPQILSLLLLPLLFVLNWYIILPLMLLFLLPIPSFFRMYYEKKAYITSLYVINTLSIKLNFKPLLASQEKQFLIQFKNASYYFMWPFSNLEKDFADAIEKIKKGERPFEDPIFNILDKLIAVV